MVSKRYLCGSQRQLRRGIGICVTVLDVTECGQGDTGDVGGHRFRMSPTRRARMRVNGRAVTWCPPTPTFQPSVMIEGCWAWLHFSPSSAAWASAPIPAGTRQRRLHDARLS